MPILICPPLKERNNGQLQCDGIKDYNHHHCGVWGQCIEAGCAVRRLAVCKLQVFLREKAKQLRKEQSVTAESHKLVRQYVTNITLYHRLGYICMSVIYIQYVPSFYHVCVSMFTHQD
jgi:hypothetical protein